MYACPPWGKRCVVGALSFATTTAALYPPRYKPHEYGGASLSPFWELTPTPTPTPSVLLPSVAFMFDTPIIWNNRSPSTRTLHASSSTCTTRERLRPPPLRLPPHNIVRPGTADHLPTTPPPLTLPVLKFPPAVRSSKAKTRME